MAVWGVKKSRQNIMTERAPEMALKFSEMASAFFRVMPGSSASQSGWFEITSKESVPKVSTIFWAVFGPTPFTAPEAR